MFTKTVDKVVSTLTKAMADLEVVRNEQLTKAAESQAAIEALQELQIRQEEEAARALRVWKRLEELLN